MSMIISLGVALFVSYLLVCIIATVVTRVAITEKKLMLLFVILAILVPPIAVWSLLKTLFGKANPLRYNEVLAEIEDEIETERVVIFGGQPIKPSLSKEWEKIYLRYLAQTTTKVANHVDRSQGYLFYTTAALIR